MAIYQSFKRGLVMSVIAYEFMMKHKKVLLFTLLSTFVVSATALAFVGVLLIKTGAAEAIRGSLLHHHVVKVLHHHIAPGSIIGLLGLLILASILHTFMKVALANYVGDIIENKPTGFFSSMGTAFSRLFLIMKWIIVNWIVGSIIRSLRGKGGGILGNIVSGLVGLGWFIVTFFVIPIMATEDIGIIKTIERSGQSMKKTFGQNVTATFAIRGGQSLLFMIVAVPLWLIAYLVWDGFGQTILHADSTGTLLTVFGIGAFALPIILVSPISLAVNTIFRVASYNYAQGKPTGPFSAEMIKESFVNKAL